MLKWHKVTFFITTLCGCGFLDYSIKSSTASSLNSDPLLSPKDPLTIESVYPSNVFIGGGVPLKITGTGFYNPLTIEIGNKKCESINIVSSKEVQCITPSNAKGDYSLKISSDNQDKLLDSKLAFSADGFTRIKHITGSLNVLGIIDGIGEQARVRRPNGLWVDGNTIYFSEYDSHVIRKLDIPSKQVTTLAGQSPDVGYVNAVGLNARFNWPTGIVKVGDNLYVADSKNHVIRRIHLPDNEVFHFAGTVGVAGATNGIGAAAKFNSPEPMTTDGTNLFVAEYGGSCIRKIVIATANVSTFAGTCGAPGNTDGIGTAARFHGPEGIFYTDGKLFVSSSSGHTIRVINVSDASVSSIAGTYLASGGTDGIGAAARFRNPRNLVKLGNFLYVADAGTTVRKIDLATNNVVTIAGAYNINNHIDGIGTDARFYVAHGLTAVGNQLWLGTLGNFRTIDPDTLEVKLMVGALSDLTSQDGTFAEARFTTVDQFATYGKSIFVTGGSLNPAVRLVNVNDGTVTTFAGDPILTGTTDGIGTSARFKFPTGIAVVDDFAYVSDSSNYCIRKINLKTAEVTTFAGLCGTTGFTDGVGSSARFGYPYGMVHKNGHLYVVDRSGHTIRDIDIGTQSVTTLAGSGGLNGSVNGIGSAARFKNPYSITEFDGFLYVTDFTNQVIRKINITTREVTTFVGNFGVSGYDEGMPGTATFYSPMGITNDQQNLYVTETLYGGRSIRKIRLSDGFTSILLGAKSQWGDFKYDMEVLGKSNVYLPGLMGILYSPEHGLLFSTSNNIKCLK